MAQSASYIKITINTDPQLEDVIADFLLGVIGAAVEQNVDLEREQPVLVAYLEKKTKESQEKALYEQLRSYFSEMATLFKVNEPEFVVEVIENQDWTNSWKVHFKPFSIIPGLVIVPSWEEYEQKSGEQIIIMDPGMAFGTGHHATTSLSLHLLQQALSRNQGAAMLDVGTGTGILAMAGALFGAKSVTGIDNDPEAVNVALRNLGANGLSNKVMIDSCSLQSLNGSYEIIVANIVHDVLLSMLSDLTRLTCPGGKLILSGILPGEQKRNIIQQFCLEEFELEKELEEGEWVALLFSKKP